MEKGFKVVQAAKSSALWEVSWWCFNRMVPPWFGRRENPLSWQEVRKQPLRGNQTKWAVMATYHDCGPHKSNLCHLVYLLSWLVGRWGFVNYRPGMLTNRFQY